MHQRTAKDTIPQVIKDLEKEVNEKANSGRYEFNIHTGFKVIDPKCPKCGNERDFVNKMYMCRVCR